MGWPADEMVVSGVALIDDDDHGEKSGRSGGGAVVGGQFYRSQIKESVAFSSTVIGYSGDQILIDFRLFQQRNFKVEEFVSL